MGSRRVAYLMLIAGVVVSCADDAAPVRSVGDGCYVASDCSSPLVCAFQRCHGQCATARDCPAGQTCVGSDYPKLGICLLSDETECKRHSDCPRPLVCGRREKCEGQCKNERDCLAGQLCAQGTCFEPTEGTDAGPPPVAGNESDTCIHASDCAAPLVCILGFCAPECVTDRDCSGGQTCVERTCRVAATADAGPTDGTTDGSPVDAPPGYGAKCTYSSECAGELVCRSDGTCGYECLTDADCPTKSYCTEAKRCVVGTRPLDAAVDAEADGAADAKACLLDFDCDDGVFCNGVERCLAGRCAPPVEPACATHSACYKGVCDEPTRKCLAPIKIGSGTDVDGDGHLDVACGGDDCDDTDPKTYKGAPELCDGVDNDCNGLVDDFAIAPRTAAMTSAAPGGRDRNGGGGAVIAASPVTGLSYSFMGGYNTGSAADISHVMVSGLDLGTLAAAFADKEFVGASPGGVWGGGRFGASAGGDASSLVVFDYNNGGSTTRYAWVGGADGSRKLSVPLVPATTSALGDATATWANGRYLVGHVIAATGVGTFGTIAPDGTSGMFAVAPIGGRLGDGSRIRVGLSGSAIAVAWLGTSGDTEVTIHTLAGSKLYGPLSLGAGNPVAVGGTSAGFAIATSTTTSTKITFVTSAGVAGASVTLPYPTFGGDGSTALGAAILALDAKDGLHLVVGRRDLADGVDDRSVFSPSIWSAADTGHVDVVSGRIFLSYFVDADNRTRFIEAGCAP